MSGQKKPKCTSYIKKSQSKHLKMTRVVAERLNIKCGSCGKMGHGFRYCRYHIDECMEKQRETLAEMKWEMYRLFGELLKDRKDFEYAEEIFGEHLRELHAVCDKLALNPAKPVVRDGQYWDFA